VGRPLDRAPPHPRAHSGGGLMDRWPDIIPVVIHHLSSSLSLPAGRVATRVRADVDTLPEFVRVRRGPGSDDEVTDSFLIDVETFTLAPTSTNLTPPKAWNLAEDARQAMSAMAGTSFSGALVDSVSTATSPTEIDYGNPKLIRYVASYRLRLRK